MDKAKREKIEEKLNRKLGEDSGNNVIYKTVRMGGEHSKDVKLEQ